METFTSEIIILSQTGPWTPAQREVARSAVRELVRTDDNPEPKEAELAQCLENGMAFARNYQRPPNSAAWPCTYYIGVETDPEYFETLASKMRQICEGSGLIVTTQHYR